MTLEDSFLKVTGISKAADTEEISLGFIRRYKLGGENWKMGLEGQLGRYAWALTPQDSGGGSSMGRKLAWNTIEALRTMREQTMHVGWTPHEQGSIVGGGTDVSAAPPQHKGPIPMWWDMQGTDPNTGKEYEDGWRRVSKKIGFAMAGKKGVPGGATLAAAEELAGIFDFEGPDAVKLETSRPSPNSEEIWTEFWLEALSDKIEDSNIDMDGDINDYTGWMSKNKDRNQAGYLQLINTMGFDFGAYTESEAMEQAFFTSLMDDVFKKAGTDWKSVGDMSGPVVAREQTSDQGGKFFARGLSRTLKSEGDMQTAFFKNTGVRVDEIVKNLTQYGSLLDAVGRLESEGEKSGHIYSDKGEEKSYGKFEGLNYISKQEADRAISLAMQQFFGGGDPSGKAGLFDYYMPLPSHSVTGFPVGSWLGQIRLKPIIEKRAVGKNVRFVLKAINYATRAYHTGLAPDGPSGVPLHAIIKHLISQNILTPTEIAAITKTASDRYNDHASAISGVANRGGIFYGELAGMYSAAMGGASAQINIVNVATSAEIAENIKAQIMSFFGGSGGGEAMAGFFRRQGRRMKDLTKLWAHVPGMGPQHVLKARSDWARSNPNLMNTTFSLREGHPFNVPSITPEGGSLVGIPYFLAKGPFDATKTEFRPPTEVKVPNKEVNKAVEKALQAKRGSALMASGDSIALGGGREVIA